MDRMQQYHELNVQAISKIGQITSYKVGKASIPPILFEELKAIRDKMFTIAVEIDTEMLELVRGKTNGQA